MPIPASSESLELIAVNQILSSIGQAPVTDLNQTNPDVAIAYNTLLEVSRDVQTEGWTFNKDYNVKVYPQIDPITLERFIPWGEDVIEMNISQDPSYFQKSQHKTVKREGKVWDRQRQTFEFPKDYYYFDFVRLYNWDDLPIPIRDYITARASAMTSQRVIGDPTQYQMLQQKEAYCRAYAMEYECNQGQYSMFGDPKNGTNYNSFQPYKALQRF